MPKRIYPTNAMRLAAIAEYFDRRALRAYAARDAKAVDRASASAIRIRKAMETPHLYKYSPRIGGNVQVQQ